MELVSILSMSAFFVNSVNWCFSKCHLPQKQSMDTNCPTIRHVSLFRQPPPRDCGEHREMHTERGCPATCRAPGNQKAHHDVTQEISWVAFRQAGGILKQSSAGNSRWLYIPKFSLRMLLMRHAAGRDV